MAYDARRPEYLGYLQEATQTEMASASSPELRSLNELQTSQNSSHFSYITRDDGRLIEVESGCTTGFIQLFI